MTGTDTMTAPRILIGMPAFRAAQEIQRALQSISRQDHSNFRVLISVDGGDSETAEACAPFLSDERFALVMQDQRLGWAGNINWLMARPDYDFFCYWQHDDHTSDDYISGLLRSSALRPAAVCYYTAIQWLGLHTDWMAWPSVTGFPLDRSMTIFETLNGIPLRGLIRKDAIERTGPIRITEFDSAFEEFVWIAKLAREGNLQFVEGPVYYKHAHDKSAHAKVYRQSRLWRRRVWLEFGLGMLETIWPLLRDADKVTAVATILDRLCQPKPSRVYLYDGPAVPFASDFVAAAVQRFPIPVLQDIVAGKMPTLRFAGELGGELLDDAIERLRRPSQLHSVAESESTFPFRFGGSGIDLLGIGWSYAEEWGIWSTSPNASLRLPVASHEGPWNVQLTLTAFGEEGGSVEIHVVGEPPFGTNVWHIPANVPVQKQFAIHSRRADVTLEFTVPEPKSPFQLGLSTDSRRLGIGLVALTLQQPA
jgi:GT2 family glycosyltransferase